jgi:CRP/FNR family transcriptional regulator, anaerobic regulatory protein
MNKLFDYLNQLFEVNAALRSALLDICTIQSYKKQTVFLQEGEPANKLYFCERGIVKKSINRYNKTITLYFINSGNFFSSNYLLNKNVDYQMSLYNWELISAGQIISIDLDKLFAAMHAFPKIHILHNQIIEKSFSQEINRSLELQFLSATEKYQAFANQFPEVLATARLKDVASSLGINQETLSRIRQKLK